jgi:hypothetical protein
MKHFWDGNKSQNFTFTYGQFWGKKNNRLGSQTWVLSFFGIFGFYFIFGTKHIWIFLSCGFVFPFSLGCFFGYARL